MVKFQNQRGAYQIRRGRHTYRGRQPSLETGRPPTNLRVCLPGDKMREARPRKPGPLAHGGRTSDRQPLSQGSGCVSPSTSLGPLSIHRGPRPHQARLVSSMHPGFHVQEPHTLSTPNSSGLWAPFRPPAAPGGGQQPEARNHLRRHVTSSFFLYKLSTCHPAVCFSLLRFSSNYVDFLHPTPSWKLIRLNIFIYYHFAQLLPAFPITLPASL